ncbi:MAG TPA: hypothetical protein VGN09_04965 [Vicinamibacteria bacterium]
MRRFSGLLALLLTAAAATAHAAGHRGWCATDSAARRDGIWTHEEREQRRPFRAQARDQVMRAGNVAVLVDQGDLALVKNPLDLQGVGLLFTPDGPSYQVSRVDVPVAASAGTRLALSDDDSRSVAIGFAFPFYGKTYGEVFVNSDGNLTFTQPDRASTTRSLGRLIGGPPRIAPLLADLDPSAGGSVTAAAAGDRLVVTWTDVPQFEVADKNTFQATLYADGRIDFAYAANLTRALEAGATGIAPGNEEGGLTAVDFANAAAVTGAGALAESFHADDELDEVATTRRFIRNFGDDYQQLVVFTNFRFLPPRSIAFERTLASRVSGIGQPLYDQSAQYGSNGRLESFVMMDAISRYPDDPAQRYLGADNTLSILGQESGHLFMAYAKFRDGNASSTDLLGRDDAHWSFFMDSDGSVMEGNDIDDLGGGSFRTGTAVVRYSPLDQYLMGLRPADEVAPFFYVKNPTGTDSSKDRGPQENVGFQGTRRDVTIEDVVAAMGPRSPAFGQAPRTLREAFVFVSVGGPPSEADLAKVERIRSAWEPFWTQAVEGRGTIVTSLN